MHDLPAQTFIAKSEVETAAVASRLAALLRGGEYISLEGDLGAGKTVFSRQLAIAFGITESVTSPTFVIQKSYQVPLPLTAVRSLIHYDLYRITNYYELLDMGFEDHSRDSVVLVEWGNLFLKDFPVAPIRVQIQIEPDDSRTITISGLEQEL